MEPHERRWWRLLDDLPGRLGTVHRWTGGRITGRTDDGHFHVTPTLVACLDGVVRVCRADDRVDLRPGDVLLIDAGVWHVHQPLRAGSVRFGQGIMAAWSDVILGDAQREWLGRLPLEPSQQMLERAIRAQAPARQRDRCAELFRQVLSESITDLTFRLPTLRRMVDRLWSGVHLGVTVDDLVRVSGLSRAQAYRVFTAGYGLSPKAAIAQARGWLARSLLAQGLSIREITDQCGYANPKACRRALGRDLASP